MNNTESEFMGQSTSDFSGFIDGFEARNLASIQRNVSVQLAEMQTRLSILEEVIETESGNPPNFSTLISEIQATFIDPAFTIVKRLVKVGTLFTSLLLAHGDYIVSKPNILIQIKGFLRAYVDAAQASPSDQLNDAVRAIASAFKEAQSRVVPQVQHVN